jgi:DNA-binding CsgD family transcriptional regulator/Na+-transporting methylmalonyl-CoA/oxaloacetate decarboxylase gamma subunit
VRARVLAVLGVGVWCFFLLFASLGMIIDRGLADVGIAWIGVLGIGVVAPVLLLWQINRAITAHEANRRATPDAREKEKELLGALEERGELTPVTAAISTSLTADEAAKMLAELARKGHVEARVQDGIVTYALGGRDSRALSGGATASLEAEPVTGAASQRLEDPLSEREIEVLALLSSGKTNAEVARDLYVSVGTVKSHTGNIYRKLEARNRAEAITRARELKLLA